MNHDKMIFASRPSKLARWQTNIVIALLRQDYPDIEFCVEIIHTRGDKILDKPLPEIGGKGLFTMELEEALLSGGVHAVVHSLKDLPTQNSPDLVIAAIPERADPRDVLISPAGFRIEQLPPKTIVGTSSLRRKAQILAIRPDFDIKDIRGNVDTRLRKVQENQYDAIVLAAAGVERLGLGDHITEYLSFDRMLPAPGQGALAVQCAANSWVASLLGSIDHGPTRMAVATERAYLSALGGGCSIPVGAYAVVEEGQITLQAVVADPQNGDTWRVSGSGNDPERLATMLAEQTQKSPAAAVLAVLQHG